MRSVIAVICSLALAACATDTSTPGDLADIHPLEQGIVDVGDFPVETVDKVYHGDTVTGAGDRGQWEGIVRVQIPAPGGGWGTCTGFFISDRHVVTAGHCFRSQGSHVLRFQAPTWNGNNPNQYTVWVNRQGTARAIDVAVVTFASPVGWATPARRFRLYTGPTRMRTMLDIYGYGANNQAGHGVGTLRTGEGRSRIRVVDHGDGYFKAEAREARTCGGDSGGPAIREGTLAIVWGTLSTGQGDGACDEYEGDITWTKMNANLDYIERAIGFTCDRYTGDGQNYARCW